MPLDPMVPAYSLVQVFALAGVIFFGLGYLAGRFRRKASDFRDGERAGRLGLTQELAAAGHPRTPPPGRRFKPPAKPLRDVRLP